MPKARFVGGMALSALAAAGCGLFPASSKPDVVVPANPTMIRYVDPSAVDGLVTMTMTEGEESPRRVHISYPRLKDAPVMNEALRTEAERQLLGFHAATEAARPAAASRSQADGSLKGDDTQEDGGDGDGGAQDAGRPDMGGADGARPGATDVDETAVRRGIGARPELNVDWQLVAASPAVFGVRLRTGRHVGVDWGRSSRTLWYDRTRDRATGSSGLLSGQAALQELARLVREGLAGRGAAVERDRVTADPALFDSMAFNLNGDLVVEFDDCQIGSCALGRVAVAVPAERAGTLLSATGHRAQYSPRAAGRTYLPGMSEVWPEVDAPSGGAGAPAGADGTVAVPEAGAPGAAAPDTNTPDTSTSDTSTSGEGASEQVDCAEVKCVALTFDDGPGPETPRLLDMLRGLGARATFFTVGANAAADPWLLGRMAAEGHEVGNHSWAHRDLSRLSTSKIADSLGRTQELIKAHTGQAPTLARAPYGVESEEVRDTARRLGLTLVGWDVNTVGSAETVGVATAGRPGAETIARRAVEGAHDGAVILLHDTCGTAVDAVPAIVEGLRGKGYALVTVGELYGEPGSRTEHAEGSGGNAAAGGP
ncbi:MAG: hypothetical protein K0R62_4861 [Nonomuraea muscovyensis]|nr:hypothetical protein [Nonomuraea muscovyensis]